MAATENEAFEPAQIVTLDGCVVIAGEVVLITVTTAVHVAILPLASVTVSVTVLFPTFVQLKVLGETDNDMVPQLSELPLSTCDAASVALPVASRARVTFLQDAIGATLSVTSVVTVTWLLDVSASTGDEVT